VMMEVGYSGTKGTHLEQTYDDNFSPPGPGNTDLKRPYQSAAIPGTSIVTSPLGAVHGYHFNGNSSYHALLAKVEKRFSRGLTLLGSYTWSKSIGDTCGASSIGDTTGCGFQDIRNLRLERSVDNNDIPQRFAVSGVYELPVGKGKHFGSNLPGAVNAIFGGWSVGSILVAASGRPYNVIAQGNNANTGTFTVVNRPNVLRDPYAIERTLDHDFDAGAFANNPVNAVGNAGRNLLRQRGSFNWDFSSHKEWRLKERVRLQFRFEAFHFTNTPRFGQAGNNMGSATFGRITGADTPRNLQVGMKAVW
jgi:hypothetical protein